MNFEMTEGTRTVHGTAITLHISEEEKESSWSCIACARC